MFAWMALVYFMVFTDPHPDTAHAAYWLMMQIAAAVGLTTSYPANIWLVRHGVKHAMERPPTEWPPPRKKRAQSAPRTGAAERYRRQRARTPKQGWSRATPRDPVFAISRSVEQAAAPDRATAAAVGAPLMQLHPRSTVRLPVESWPECCSGEKQEAPAS
jgi:hypothetical protein